jgi:hypothetical protein
LFDEQHTSGIVMEQIGINPGKAVVKCLFCGGDGGGKALGIDSPQSILLRANELIE